MFEVRMLFYLLAKELDAIYLLPCYYILYFCVYMSYASDKSCCCLIDLSAGIFDVQALNTCV